jgi:hypothetical protein
LTEESARARRVIEEHASEMGLPLDELAEEIATYGHHETEEARELLANPVQADPVFIVAVTETLGLGREEYYRLMDQMLADAREMCRR